MLRGSPGFGADKMRRKLAPLTMAGLALAAFACACPAHAATFQGLGALPGGEFGSIAEDVSGDGSVVVGMSYVEPFVHDSAFRWTAEGGMEALTGEAPTGHATGVSRDGSVIVGMAFGDSRRRAFRWTSQTGAILLDTVQYSNGTTSQQVALCVSPDGGTVSGVDLYEGMGTTSEEPFLWTPSTGTVLLSGPPPPRTQGPGDIGPWAMSDDGAVVVGGYRRFDGATHYEAFLWTAEDGIVGLGDLPGGTLRSCAYGVSADGKVVVGEGRDDSRRDQAFRWTEAEGMAGLGYITQDGSSSTAYDVSADGSVIVGTGRVLGLGDQAFVWDARHGVRNLTDVLELEYGLDLTGWRLTEAKSISDDGTVIVGNGRNPAGQEEAWIARLDHSPAVPTAAPWSLALTIVLIAGLYLLASVARKARREAMPGPYSGLWVFAVVCAFLATLQPSAADEFVVNDTSEGNQGLPALGMSSSGKFVVAWVTEEQDGSSFDVWAKLYNETGMPQGSEFRVNAETARTSCSRGYAHVPRA